MNNLKKHSQTKINHHGLSSYKDLIEILKTLSEEDLQQTITVYDEKIDEYYACNIQILTVEETDVLDADHKVILINIKGE